MAKKAKAKKAKVKVAKSKKKLPKKIKKVKKAKKAKIKKVKAKKAKAKAKKVKVKAKVAVKAKARHKAKPKAKAKPKVKVNVIKAKPTKTKNTIIRRPAPPKPTTVFVKLSEPNPIEPQPIEVKITGTREVQNIVVAGKSGAGKQPRIDVLLNLYNLKQLSTGNIFREFLGAFSKVRGAVQTEGLWQDGQFAPDSAIQAALEQAAIAVGVPVEAAVLGFKAAQYVDRGLFVPDDITNALLAAAFKSHGGKGLVLDGYPRTPEQSEFLIGLTRESGTGIDLVLVVDNDDDAIVARTIGRRICPNKTCGKVFHLQYKPPTPDGKCTACGATVILRSDDTEEKIRTRLAEFQQKALPAIHKLTAAGIPTVAVPGNLPVFTDEAVRESVLGVVQPVLGH
jgi:adenylate kinase family enzyme